MGNKDRTRVIDSTETRTEKIKNGLKDLYSHLQVLFSLDIWITWTEELRQSLCTTHIPALNMFDNLRSTQAGRGGTRVGFRKAWDSE